MAIRRFRFGLIASALAVALLAAGVIAITSSTGAARAATPDPAGCATGTDIQTASGPVCGITSNGINEWLGIPYAAPPVGALRWQPPQPPTPWTSTLAATQFGSECAQQFGSSTVSGSENCLFVN